MSFDKRLRACCVVHARALEQLEASIMVDGVEAKIHSLREHLRQMYSLRPTAFDHALVEFIKRRFAFAEAAKTNQNNLGISSDDQSFVVGHFYG